MTTKDAFSADEWKSVAKAPFLVSMAIGIADPSGPFGMIKEGNALAMSIQKAATGGAGEVAKEVAAAIREDRPSAKDLMAKGAKSTDQASEHAIGELKAIATLVETKVPSEGAAFKTWLLEMAQGIAEASKEGGFLGFGGKVISEDEKEALDDLHAALS